MWQESGREGLVQRPADGREGGGRHGGGTCTSVATAEDAVGLSRRAGLRSGSGALAGGGHPRRRRGLGGGGAMGRHLFAVRTPAVPAGALREKDRGTPHQAGPKRCRSRPPTKTKD